MSRDAVNPSLEAAGEPSLVRTPLAHDYGITLELARLSWTARMEHRAHTGGPCSAYVANSGFARSGP
jgi:hypothetical protein